MASNEDPELKFQEGNLNPNFHSFDGRLFSSSSSKFGIQPPNSVPKFFFK